MGARSPFRAALAPLLLAAACAVVPYDPYPVTVRGGMPADAFERCRAVFAARHLSLVEVDEAAFRLQTGWDALQVEDAAVQQRVSLFRHGDGLGLVVEVRHLREGWFGGLPAWSAPCADQELERELGQVLAEALSPPPVDGR
jgi:hypothetical protein